MSIGANSSTNTLICLFHFESRKWLFYWKRPYFPNGFWSNFCFILTLFTSIDLDFGLRHLKINLLMNRCLYFCIYVEIHHINSFRNNQSKGIWKISSFFFYRNSFCDTRICNKIIKTWHCTCHALPLSTWSRCECKRNSEFSVYSNIFLSVRFCCSTSGSLHVSFTNE